jgi:Na+-driven multidrug efflux pump
MYTTIIGTWGVRLPFAYIIGVLLGGGIVWVWIAMLADWIARSSILFYRYRWGRQFS